jgi:hypothetical protein
MRSVHATDHTNWPGPIWSLSRFAGGWVILPPGTRRTRFAGWVVLAGPPSELDGGHPAAFELGQDQAALFPGRAHAAPGVHGHRQLRRLRSRSGQARHCRRSHNYENYESYQNPPPVVLHRTVTFERLPKAKTSEVKSLTPAAWAKARCYGPQCRRRKCRF